jgi:hypothetical protein
MRSRVRFLAAIAPLTIGVTSSLVRAADPSWIIINGNWNVPGNWSTGLVPGNGDFVHLTFNDALSRGIVYNYTGPAVTYLQMDLNNDGAGTPQFAQNSASTVYSVQNENIGTTGTGNWVVNGGVHNALNLGFATTTATSQGFGFQNNGAVNVSNAEIIGLMGAASFRQTNGTNTCGILEMGTGSLSTGSYSLTGGTLTSGSDEIGDRGSASLLISGGFHTVNNNATFGANAGATGFGSLTVGTFNVTGGLILGGLGSGSLIQGSGALICGSMSLGAQATGTGTYELDGAVATFTNGYHVGDLGAGKIILPGGSMTLTGDGYVGVSGAGTVNQTGGVQTIGTSLANRTLSIGSLSSGIGTYLLSGTGSLAVNGFERVGDAGSGIFNQSSGIHSIVANDPNSFTLLLGAQAGGHGAYVLSGGTLITNASESVGINGGVGTFLQSGGTHTAANLDVCFGSASTGYYQLSAGSLVVSTSEFVANPTGSFEQTGGVHIIGTAPNSATLSILGGGTFYLSGTASLSVNSTELVGSFGSGTFNQSGGVHTVSGSGSGELRVASASGTTGLYLLSGGTLSVDGSFEAGYAGNGTINQSGGTVTTGLVGLGISSGSAGTYLLSGDGYLSAINEELGFSGTANFIQSGGTNVASGIDLAGAAGQTASYSLSGGLLVVPGTGGVSVASAGNGTFNQNGGDFEIPSSTHLALGGSAGSSGTYLLSGTGALNVQNTETVGASGVGNFLQSGATNSAGILNIAQNGGSAGTYSLSGGSLTVITSAYVGGSSLGPGGTGILVINGGEMTVGSTLRLFDTGTAVPFGTEIDLMSGTLSVGFLDISANRGRFNWTGGTLRIFASGLNVGNSGSFGPALSLNSKTLMIPQGTTIDIGAKLEGTSATMTGGSFTNSGKVSFVDSTLSFNAASTNSLGATISLIGSTMNLGTGPSKLINQGRMNLIDSTINGDIANTGGGQIDTAGNVTFNGAITGGGALAVHNQAQFLPGSVPNDPARSEVLQTLSIDSGASLDLANNSMILDYAGPVGTLVSDVRQHLHNLRLLSSSATSTRRLGYGDNTVLLKPTFAGHSVDASSVLIKYTYAGDADLDGDADGVDIGTWATNFTGELGGTGSMVWTQGDWDYDGDVDGVDAGLWAQAFTGELGGGGLGNLIVNNPNIAPAAASILRGMGIIVVPEPAAVGFLAGLGTAAVSCRRRRSRVIGVVQRPDQAAEKVFREDFVVEGARSAVAASLDGRLAVHSEISQNQRNHQRRPVEPHATMSEHPVAAAREFGTEPGHRMQPVQIGQLVVLDRQVNIEKLVEQFRNPVINAAFQVDHGVDPTIQNRFPVMDSGREEQASLVIHRNDLMKHVHCFGHLT